MERGDDQDPLVDDWFEEEPPEPPRRRRPGLARPGAQRPRTSVPPRTPPPIALLAAAVAGVLLLVIVIVSLTGGEDQPEQPAVPPVATAPVPVEPETPESEDPEVSEPPALLPAEATIRPGDEGEQVRALQQALVQLGYDPGEPDGNYGGRTTDAVQRFQTDAGLQADGVAGPVTLQAINERLSDQG